MGQPLNFEFIKDAKKNDSSANYPEEHLEWYCYIKVNQWSSFYPILIFDHLFNVDDPFRKARIS